ncbi:SGNH/GDSL hydrolase family protein [Labilibacter marinus]|uniref:SGNH/GDSL hydrolase family protein n=1 Tax=Labilibacter marinus TaxID=1477105 RepID=UPI00082F4060|nr:SGNH/GDSL hydrolase family protein [Labilibacter marinus]
MKNISILLLLIALITGCQPSIVKVEPSNSELSYVGRINFENPNSPELYWSASSVSMNFKGCCISATLTDQNGENYYNVVIDGQAEYPIKLDKGAKTYVLADSLDSSKAHSITLVKRNEWPTGSTQFNGFIIENGKVLKASPKKEKFIEFYGNSITAGYAIEDNTGGDSPDSTFTNNYKTYAALTARHFNADIHCTVRSGIGIQVSWDRPIMPEIYNRLNPLDSLSIWDFSQKIPNLVVINLMQNDSWLVKLPNNDQFKYRFGNEAPSPVKIIDAYAKFVSSIREVYPNTPIVCALGSMSATEEGSPWPGYVQQAVDSLDDSNIYTHVFPYINKSGHPRVDDNKKMAASLISFIDENIKW